MGVYVRSYDICYVLRLFFLALPAIWNEYTPFFF